MNTGRLNTWPLMPYKGEPGIIKGTEIAELIEDEYTTGPLSAQDEEVIAQEVYDWTQVPIEVEFKGETRVQGLTMKQWSIMGRLNEVSEHHFHPNLDDRNPRSGLTRDEMEAHINSSTVDEALAAIMALMGGI